MAVEEDEEDVKEADGEFNEEFAALLKRLPVQIQEYYRDGGITTLYDWQRRCIAEMNADASSNYIYSLPTSSGKTLVAELLALQNVFLDGKDAFFVLPFVAVAEEKAAAFTRILARFDPEHAPFQVEVYAGFKGRLPPIRRKRKPIIFVATIEKGYALLHALFEKRRMMRNLGLVVVDELHMLGTSRGSLLELFLTLLRVQQRPPLASSSKMFTSRQEDCVYAEHSARIVAMSATLSNMSELCQFLNAKEFVGTFRPVALEEHVKSANHCFTVPEFLVWSQAQVKHGPSSDKRAKLAATSTQGLSSHKSVLFHAECRYVSLDSKPLS